MADIAKLERVMSYIKAHPEKHNQEIWTCNTGACFAGHAVLLNGWETTEEDGTVRNRITGETRHVENLAMQILGLSGDEATILFDAYNTAERLEMMVRDIANGEDLDDLWKEREEHDPDHPDLNREVYLRVKDNDQEGATV